MKKCKIKIAVTKAKTIKPTLLKRLIPNRKTINKWIKWLAKAFKVEIVIGDMFKWIFLILVWITIFPNSIIQLKLVAQYVVPFL